MRLALQMPERKSAGTSAGDVDPREEQSAEVIDLASRNSYPTVSQRKGGSDTLGLLAGVAVVSLMGIAAFWGMNTGREASQEALQPQANVPAAVPVEVPAQPIEEEPRIAAPAAPRPDPAPQAILSNPPNQALAPMGNPYSSPALTYDNSTAATMVDPAAAAAQAAGAATGTTAQDFAARIGVGGGPARAVAMSNPQTTVTQGTLIPAILETAIDTDVPGFVRAVVSQDVRSFDGTRVLVPRSSRLIGQYQSGLQAGQKRAYVIWTRLIRPDGVSVDLASPATDFSGQAGLPGDVDTHFFKRFGSAMLLSVIGGLTTIASGGASVILGGGESAAAAALNQDGKIGPTVRVRQGEPIRVFTARDLDFSRVATQ
jgi:type IV secretion system protein VirB10